MLGYGYDSIFQLCATLVSDLRRPLFADVSLAKGVLASLLSDQTLKYMRVRAFTLMPDHLRLLAGVRLPESDLPTLLGGSRVTQLNSIGSVLAKLWSLRRSFCRQGLVEKTDPNESRPLLAALMEWRATLRPEKVELKNWPRLKPQQFLGKCLWQEKFFDHVIRNDTDLHENLDYIAMNRLRQDM